MYFDRHQGVAVSQESYASFYDKGTETTANPKPQKSSAEVYPWQAPSSSLSAPQIDSGGLQKFRFPWQASSSTLSAPQIDSGGLQKFRMRLGLAVLPYIILYNQGSTPSCRRPGQYAPVVTPPSYTSPLATGGSPLGVLYLALL